MKLRLCMGVILVVASLLKLATLWGIVDSEWLNRTAEEPWATYFAPVILIIVGASLIYDFCKAKENK